MAGAWRFARRATFDLLPRASRFCPARAGSWPIGTTRSRCCASVLRYSAAMSPLRQCPRSRPICSPAFLASTANNTQKSMSRSWMSYMKRCWTWLLRAVSNSALASNPTPRTSCTLRPCLPIDLLQPSPRRAPFRDVHRIAWRELLAHPFIALQRPSTVRTMMEERLREQGLELVVSMESHQLATVGALVAAGLGVSAVPALCARQMQLLGARCVPLHAPSVDRSVGLITGQRAELSVAAVALHAIAVRSRRA